MGLFGKSDGGKKGKSTGVDPAEMLALRAEMADLKSRLEAAEQERAVIAAHLNSLDASATAFASTRSNIERITSKVEQLETQVQAPAPAASTMSTEALSAKVDALHQRMLAAPDVAPKIAEIEAMLNEVSAKVQAPMAPPSSPPPSPVVVAAGPDLSPRLAELEQMLTDMAARVDQASTTADEAASAAAAAVERATIATSSAPASEPAESSPSLLGDMPSPAELELLGRLDELQQRVAMIDALQAQVESLNARVDQTSAATDSVAEQVALVAAVGRGSDEDAAQASQAAIAEQAAQLAQLAERVAATDATARQATEQVSGIDQRLSNISTELANQISELGRDIDSLASQPAVAASGISDETIDALRASQVKLAGEQARYEIAFREDLAALAEQIRRGAR